MTACVRAACAEDPAQEEKIVPVKNRLSSAGGGGLGSEDGSNAAFQMSSTRPSGTWGELGGCQSLDEGRRAACPLWQEF